MILTRKFAAVLLAALAAAAAIAFSVRAQPQGQVPMPAQPQNQVPMPARPQGQIPMPAQQPAPAAPAINRNLILLDPAHGGSDPGGTLSGQVLEKNVTLAFALKLRAALAAANFTVATTRDGEITDPLTTDQRAEIANRTHALACITLHATAAGTGVHLYTSALQPPTPPEDSSAYVPIPWETAQAASIPQSQSLAAGLSSALAKANLPVLSGQAAVKPLDNLMCPAVAVEIAPLQPPGEDPTPATDAAYQQHVVEALTSALQAWRDQIDTQAASAESAAQAQAISAANSAGAAAGRTNLQPAQPSRTVPQ